MILRYFNVAGADPLGRTGQSTKGATHLIKVAVETALGRRPKMDVFGTDYATPDGTCIRDYIHVSDLVRAHSDALAYLRGGGASATLNCGYGRGFSVLEVIDTVKRVAGVDFKVDFAERRARRSGADRRRLRPHPRARSPGSRSSTISTIVAHALAWERTSVAATSTRHGPQLPASARPRGADRPRLTPADHWIDLKRAVPGWLTESRARWHARAQLGHRSGRA